MTEHTRTQEDVLSMLFEIETAVSPWILVGHGSKTQEDIYDGILSPFDVIETFTYSSNQELLLPILVDIMCTDTLEEPYHILQGQHRIKDFIEDMAWLVYHTCQSDDEILETVIPTLKKSTAGTKFISEILTVIKEMQDDGYDRVTRSYSKN